MCIQGTLVNVTAGDAITGKADLTDTCVRTSRVPAARIDITVVTYESTLVNVRTTTTS